MLRMEGGGGVEHVHYYGISLSHSLSLSRFFLLSVSSPASQPPPHPLLFAFFPFYNVSVFIIIITKFII